MIISCIKCDKDIHVNILNWKPNKPIYILCEECQKIENEKWLYLGEIK